MLTEFSVGEGFLDLTLLGLLSPLVGSLLTGDGTGLFWHFKSLGLESLEEKGFSCLVGGGEILVVRVSLSSWLMLLLVGRLDDLGDSIPPGCDTNK